MPKNEGKEIMAKYMVCPRCELNFIDADVQEYCDVCVKELSGQTTFMDDIESSQGVEETELCPVCGENYMSYGEKMCEECKKKNTYDNEQEEDEEKEDASWRSYLEDEEELDLGIPDSEFEEEEEEEEEEEIQQVEDDFEYVSADDYYDMDDDDDDDDDDEDDFDDDDAPMPKSASKKRKRKEDDF